MAAEEYEGRYQANGEGYNEYSGFDEYKEEKSQVRYCCDFFFFLLSLYDDCYGKFRRYVFVCIDWLSSWVIFCVFFLIFMETRVCIFSAGDVTCKH